MNKPTALVAFALLPSEEESFGRVAQTVRSCLDLIDSRDPENGLEPIGSSERWASIRAAVSEARLLVADLTQTTQEERGSAEVLVGACAARFGRGIPVVALTRNRRHLPFGWRDHPFVLVYEPSRDGMTELRRTLGPLLQDLAKAIREGAAPFEPEFTLADAPAGGATPAPAAAPPADGAAATDAGDHDPERVRQMLRERFRQQVTGASTPASTPPAGGPTASGAAPPPPPPPPPAAGRSAALPGALGDDDEEDDLDALLADLAAPDGDLTEEVPYDPNQAPPSPPPIMKPTVREVPPVADIPVGDVGATPAARLAALHERLTKRRDAERKARPSWMTDTIAEFGFDLNFWVEPGATPIVYTGATKAFAVTADASERADDDYEDSDDELEFDPSEIDILQQRIAEQRQAQMEQQAQPTTKKKLVKKKVKKKKPSPDGGAAGF